MAALGTNILAGWLTQNDAARCARIARRFVAAMANGEALWVSGTVLLETEWVPRSRYGFAADAIGAAFDQLLDTATLSWRDSHAVARALWLFRKHPGADSADCLHSAMAIEQGATPLLSLDRRAARLAGIELLGA